MADPIHDLINVTVRLQDALAGMGIVGVPEVRLPDSRAGLLLWTHSAELMNFFGQSLGDFTDGWIKICGVKFTWPT